MADHGTSCPDNLTLREEPVRGCGRKTERFLTCDSVLIPATMKYSIVCGRIYADQRGQSGAFAYSVYYSPILLGVTASIESPYVSGLSLTHGLVGQRKHVWTFAGANDETVRYFDSTCPCTNPAFIWTINFPLMWVTVISAILVLILIYPVTHSTRTTLCGMARAVVGLAPAAVLIVLHGFVSI